MKYVIIKDNKMLYEHKFNTRVEAEFVAEGTEDMDMEVMSEVDYVLYITYRETWKDE